MTALQRLCGRLQGSRRPIILMILRLKHDSFYDGYLDDVRSIVETLGAPGEPLSKVLVTIEHAIHYSHFVNGIDCVDVSRFGDDSETWDVRKIEERRAESARILESMLTAEPLYHNVWS